MNIRKRYDEPTKSTIDTGAGLTEQAHARETDINFILKDYQRTGLMRHAKQNQGRYDDVTPLDFAQAMEITANARSMFEELPSSFRRKFSNSPALFLDYVQNPDNKDSLEKMGILIGNDGVDVTGAATLAPVEAKEAIADTGPLDSLDVNGPTDTQ